MPITDYVIPSENFADVYKYDDAINIDIRDKMEIDFPKAVKQFRNIEKIFKGRDERETAALIWTYLRKHCKYRRDPDHNQIIRLPSYLLNHNPKYGDCKTFAMLARSIYAAIYPDLLTAFKFTNYRSVPNPSHVYTVVKDSAGREIIIDGCWNTFDDEKIYNLALPLKFKAMRVTSLSGHTDPGEILNNLNANLSADKRNRIKELCRLRQRMNYARAEFDGGHISPAQFKARISDIESSLHSINAPAKKKEKGKAGKALGRGLAMIFLAPGRGAFLAVIALNLGGLATKMQKLIDLKKFSGVLKKWKQFGGGEKIFIRAITKGAKKKPLFLSKKAKARFDAKMKGIHGFEDSVYVGDLGIGIAPLAAVAAAAVPVLAGLIPAIMKAFGGAAKEGAPQEQAEAQAHFDDLQGQGQDLIEADKKGEGYQQAFTSEEDTGLPPINPDNVIGGIGDAKPFYDTLGQMAGKGIEWIVNKVKAKAAKNPKLKQTLEKGGQAVDDYFTGRYVRQSGAKDVWQQAQAAGSSLMKFAPLAVLALVGFIAFKKK